MALSSMEKAAKYKTGLCQNATILLNKINKKKNTNVVIFGYLS